MQERTISASSPARLASYSFAAAALPFPHRRSTAPSTSIASHRPYSAASTISAGEAGEQAISAPADPSNVSDVLVVATVTTAGNASKSGRASSRGAAQLQPFALPLLANVVAAPTSRAPFWALTGGWSDNGDDEEEPQRA